VLVDAAPDALAAGRVRAEALIGGQLDRLVAAGSLDVAGAAAQRAASLALLETADSLDALGPSTW